MLLQRLRNFVDQGSQLRSQFFIDFFSFIEELLDGVLESDDDEDEDDEVSWKLLTPHRKFVPNYSKSLPCLEKLVQKWRF